tara:strand:- start:43 stop:915 length:873 start_codon:yes stop_codon:yes gene_type:complete
MKKLKLLDTFSGIGGFSYAAEKLVGGFETTQFVENDPYCQKVLNKHWPNVPIHDDITTFTAEPFQFDAICGGFPCQDISTAGKGKGITQETRSGLFYELIRIIRMVRPKYVILENVAAILTNGLDIVLRELSEAGYDAEWSIISASSLGACHKRSRWWLVAYPKSFRGDGRQPDNNAEQGEEERNVGGCNSKKSTDPKGSKGNEYETERGDGKTRIQKVSRDRDRSENPHTWRSTEHRLNPNWRQYVSEPCLRRGDDGLRDRVDRLKALGNSVVPQVAAIPLQRVKDIYE